MPSTDETRSEHMEYVKQEGREVFKHAVRSMSEAADFALHFVDPSIAEEHHVIVGARDEENIGAGSQPQIEVFGPGVIHAARQARGRDRGDVSDAGGSGSLSRSAAAREQRGH